MAGNAASGCRGVAVKLLKGNDIILKAPIVTIAKGKVNIIEGTIIDCGAPKSVYFPPYLQV